MASGQAMFAEHVFSVMRQHLGIPETEAGTTVNLGKVANLLVTLSANASDVFFAAMRRDEEVLAAAAAASAAAERDRQLELARVERAQSTCRCGRGGGAAGGSMPRQDVAERQQREAVSLAAQAEHVRRFNGKRVRGTWEDYRTHMNRVLWRLQCEGRVAVTGDGHGGIRRITLLNNMPQAEFLQEFVRGYPSGGARASDITAYFSPRGLSWDGNSAYTLAHGGGKTIWEGWPPQ
jgi:hypothetical protein